MNTHKNEPIAVSNATHMNGHMNTQKNEPISVSNASHKNEHMNTHTAMFATILATILAIILFALLLSGCVAINFTGQGAILGKGDIETYEFNVGEYSKIRAEGYFDIHYYAVPSGTVTLETYPNLREHYTVEVKDGELVVSSARSINFNTGTAPVLTVSTPVLEQLNISGASAFKAHDKIAVDSFDLMTAGACEGNAELDVGSVAVSTSGAGSFKLSGSADTASFDMSGAGELNALNLQTRESKINLSGVGVVKINCSESLKINAGGAGSIEYKGSPAVDIVKGGLINVKKVD